MVAGGRFIDALQLPNHPEMPDVMTLNNGQKVKKSQARIDGTFQGPDEMMELVALHLHRLGAWQCLLELGEVNQ